MRSSSQPRKSLTFLLLCVLAAWNLAAAAGTDQADAKRYLKHVKTLTADSMEGRGAGTEGLERAARYLEEQFRSVGLKPAGENGSYRQAFTVTTGARLRENNHLTTREGAGEQELKREQDYLPLSFSSTGELSAPMVFAGYGASAPEFGYDDYAHTDVKDKIVLLLRYEPPGFSKDSGQKTHHSHLITKAITARQHGAKAVILVNGKLETGEEDLLIGFGQTAGPEDAGIVMVQVKNAVADRWLAAAGESLAKLQEEIDKNQQPKSLALPQELRVSLAVDIERVRATVHNMLGYLPGKSDEYVIVGAHYDHLGYGGRSSLAPSETGKIHPGADDNASGTAAVLELARLLAGRSERRERGVLFASFAGEEIGLLGSAHWAGHPTLPLDKALAMLNLDMVGRIKDGKLYVGGVGTGSTFKPLLEKLAAKYEFDFQYSAGGYAASDHTSFVSRKKPVLFFFSGLHSDYHKPTDTWEKIDAKSTARLVDLVAELTSTLASAEPAPQFVQVAAAESAHGGPGGGGGYGPYFGSIPDFGEIPEGVKFADIKPGSPADKAGLKPGDILVQFGEMAIHNLYDFTYALRASKVGDVVEVKVLREGKPVSATVKLEQRR